MNLSHCQPIARLGSATMAACITVALFGSVVAIGEPQRSRLLAVNAAKSAESRRQVARTTPTTSDAALRLVASK